jgi:hypothetical protein
MQLLIPLALLLSVCGLACAFIGPRKGYTSLKAFSIGVVFSIFGIVWLGLQEDLM